MAMQIQYRLILQLQRLTDSNKYGKMSKMEKVFGCYRF